MATMESWERWCADVDMNPDPEWYQPEITVKGSTRPFRPEAERPGPEGNFPEGFACGFALALPLWFALTAVVLWLAGR